jgi:hypothetical protein
MIWDLALNYDGFRDAWQRALDEAGLGPHLFPARETLDLGHMDRTYQVHVALPSSERVKPFSVAATLEWTWDALQAARTATTEEDLLMMLLGDERRHVDTEQPWLRVDITLRASLPLDSPLPLPEPAVWHRWVTDVTARLAHLLPADYGDKAHERLVLAWRGEPEAQAQCAPDGRLYLTKVTLSAWQGINLPRHWDDPDREPDGEPDDQLVDLAKRVWQALQAWEHSLRYLRPAAL